MTGLNANHKRRILASFEYADKLLEECLHTPTPGRHPLFSGYVQDLSPSESHWVESYADKIREQMLRLLERCGIEPPSPTTLRSCKLRTGLISLDITLEDIYPDQMRGYGEMDPAAASDLSWTLQEIRRLVSQLLAFLSESQEAQANRLADVQTEPALAGLLERMARIIARHGLVEFLPALDAIIRKVESHQYEIAVFGRVSSGKSSLINRLLEIELLPVGTTPITAVPIHIVSGSEPRLRVTFPDHVEELPVERMAEFATEQGNPANAKRVVALEASVASRRLQEGIAFVDTPGIASLATSGTKLSYAYLPDSDLGLVLVDGHSSLGREDLDLLRSLHAAGIPSVVMISKCDLLSPADVEKVLSYTRNAVAEHLGSTPEVIPISSVASWVPEVDAWFERSISPLLRRAREALFDSVNRKALSLRESLLATLEMKASRSTTGKADAQDTERVLRPLDESLAAFKRRWENELDRIPGWEEEIQVQAASALARRSAGTEKTTDLSSNLVTDTVIGTVASHCNPFLHEYRELADRISAGIYELKESDQASDSAAQELPRPSALPSPAVSTLDGIAISPPGPLARMSLGARTRHFRRELEEKLGSQMQQILQEMRPRLKHWFQATIHAFEENFRLQTDPLRYRSAAENTLVDKDALKADIALLRSENVDGESSPAARAGAEVEQRRA
jgi:GTP-binding protein EngB required for normal cell division